MAVVALECLEPREGKRKNQEPEEVEVVEGLVAVEIDLERVVEILEQEVWVWG